MSHPFDAAIKFLELGVKGANMFANQPHAESAKAAIRFLEAGKGVPRWAALQIQPHQSESSDTLMSTLAFHEYPDLNERIRALLSALPDKEGGK